MTCMKLRGYNNNAKYNNKLKQKKIMYNRNYRNNNKSQGNVTYIICNDVNEVHKLLQNDQKNMNNRNNNYAHNRGFQNNEGRRFNGKSDIFKRNLKDDRDYKLLTKNASAKDMIKEMKKRFDLPPKNSQEASFHKNAKPVCDNIVNLHHSLMENDKTGNYYRLFATRPIKPVTKPEGSDKWLVGVCSFSCIVTNLQQRCYYIVYSLAGKRKMNINDITVDDLSLISKEAAPDLLKLYQCVVNSVPKLRKILINARVAGRNQRRMRRENTQRKYKTINKPKNQTIIQNDTPIEIINIPQLKKEAKETTENIFSDNSDSKDDIRKNTAKWTLEKEEEGLREINRLNGPIKLNNIAVNVQENLIVNDPAI